MPSQIALPEADYGVGTRTFAIDALPPNSDGFEITLSRVSWPAGPVLTLEFDISDDNGATWGPWLSFVLSGGVIMGPGGPAAESRIRATWPGESDGAGGIRARRQTDVRLTARVLQPIRTAIVLRRI